MIVYFSYKSKVGKGILMGLSLCIYIYVLYIHAKILKLDIQTLQIISKNEVFIEEKEVDKEPEQGQNHQFVASSRGKYYYPINCSKGKSLSVKNMLYFKDKMSALAAGYIEYIGC